MSLTTPRKVHIRDVSGRLLYTRLLDYGSGVLLFGRDTGTDVVADSSGFIDRLDVDREHWTIEHGWPETTVERERKLEAERCA